MMGLGFSLAARFAVVVLLWLAAGAHAGDTGSTRTVDGVTVAIGVVPASIVQQHPKEHPEGSMHRGVPVGGDYHHLMVALFESGAGGKRIIDAEVKATIEVLGRTQSEKKLEPMTVAGALTFGNFFDMPGSDPYRIVVKFRRPGASSFSEAKFEYRHPRF